MTHPLAKKAAEKITTRAQNGYPPTMDYCSTIIHTTAVEPILKAGEGLRDAIALLLTRTWTLDDEESKLVNQALAEWRRVKGGE